MIVGSNNDRIINWGGNFDTFVVPFKQWGEPTVNRLPQPALQQFLYNLSAADGADNVLADYNASGIDHIAGLDPTRNGEPFGEMGLYLQQDALWQSQHGGPNQPPAGNLQVEAAPPPVTDVAVATITDDQLASTVAAAKELWTSALGADDPRLAALDQITIVVGNLGGGALGDTIGHSITIDGNAQGWGWFVDPTPLNNREFAISLGNGVFGANPASPAYSHMDLLSTVLHELGNAMGFAEDTGQDVTGMTLSAGLRRLPTGDPSLNGTAAGALVQTSQIGNVPSSDTVLAHLPAQATDNAAAGPPVTGIVPGLVVAAAPPPRPGPIVGSLTNGGSQVTNAKGAINFGPAISWSSDAPGGSSGAPSWIPVPTGHGASQTAPKADAAVLISWSSSTDSGSASLDGSPAGASSGWLDDFLHRLGQNEAAFNPNASLRVQPGASGHA
jgi:hypothetical protein